MTRQRHGWVLAGTVGVLLLAGCLQREVSETWYLDPTGGVTWTIIEREVRSDAPSALDRHNEEAAYLSAVERNDHPVARGLRLLASTEVRTTTWRREAPFTVMTEARFASIDLLGRQLIERLGWSGTSLLTRADGTTTWTLTLRPPPTPSDAEPVDDDLAAVLGDLDHLRVVLTAGRFQDATGFTISADGRVAIVDWPDDIGTVRATVLQLTWR